MKETKVYVDIEPRKIATQLVDLENEQFNCVILMFDTDVKPIEVIIDPKLKTHDRELVKEVCEKIRNAVNKSLEEIGGNCNGELYGQYICKGLVDYDSIEFAEILDQIQKEFEK